MTHRIATVSYDWYPHEPRALRQVEAAVAGGYAVDVFCCKEPGRKHFEVDHGIRVYRMPIGRVHGDSMGATMVKWCAFLLLVGLTLSWMQLRRRYRVVHVHNMPDVLVFSALLPKLLGARIILDIQDVSPELMGAKVERRGFSREVVIRLAKWQERISIAFAHHVVTTGSIFEGLLIQRGTPKSKITNILNSANPKVFPSECRRDAPDLCDEQCRPFIVMYHGTLAKRNGLDIAIRALKLARCTVPNLRLDIQGNGEHLPFLKQLAIDLSVEDAVTFRDFTPIDKLADFVLHGDVGIIPYRQSGFSEYVLPTKAYEYAWMRRPIIASNTIAIRSMFRPESVLLCDPSSPESFADAIIDLYQHPEKRRRMVESAAEDYIPYQWESMARLYQQLLSALCKE